MERTINFLKCHDNFAIFAHLNPDGDALGSAFSLAAGLRVIAKQAVVYLLAPVPFKYNFDAFNSLHLYYPTDFNPTRHDACIAVDCADIARLGEAKNKFNNYHSLNIDHHISNTNYADVNYIKQTAATGEIIYEILNCLKCPLNLAAQIGIYMAIASDTGNFTFPNTTKSTFKVCAEIVSLGMPVSDVADRIFNSRSMSATLLIGIYIDRIKLYFADKVSISYILLDDLNKTGAKLEDCETLVGYGRAINTVKLAIFIREISHHNYKLSLRSKGNIDVAKFAALYGGGGHKNAAGCILTGDFDYVLKSIIKIAGEYIN